MSIRSFWRTMRRSPSWGVVNNPPSVSSQWKASSWSAASRASVIHRAIPESSYNRVNASTKFAKSAAIARCFGVASRCQVRSQRPSLRRIVVATKLPACCAAVAHSSLAYAAAASASDEIMSAFHSVITLSSRPGRCRVLRAANKSRRIVSMSSSRSSTLRCSSRQGIDLPSKLPASVISYQSSAFCTKCSGMMRRTWSGVNT